MVDSEELKLLKEIGDSCKVKDLWIKVYDDETKKDGLISVLELFESVLRSSQSDIKEKEKQNGK